MTALLLAAAAEGGPVESIARTFGVDWPHFGAQLISFSIVCVALHRFAYRPILAMLEERRVQIAKGLANAAQIEAELAQTEAQRREVMAAAEVAAAQFIEEARAAAARLQQREEQKAIAAAADIVHKARDAALRERSRVRAELKAELGRLVVETTAAVMDRVLTKDDQRRLVEETAKRLPS